MRVRYISAAGRTAREIWNTRIVSCSPRVLDRVIVCAHPKVGPDDSKATGVNRKIGVPGYDWIRPVTGGPNEIFV